MLFHVQIVSFTSFLKTIPFSSYSHSLAMARACNAILNKSGMCGLPRLISDVTGEAFSF